MAINIRGQKMYHGVPIIESSHLTINREIATTRTMMERFISWPWRPWVKTKTAIIKVPDPAFYISPGRVTCHPETAKQLMAKLNEQGGVAGKRP